MNEYDRLSEWEVEQLIRAYGQRLMDVPNYGVSMETVDIIRKLIIVKDVFREQRIDSRKRLSQVQVHATEGYNKLWPPSVAHPVQGGQG